MASDRMPKLLVQRPTVSFVDTSRIAAITETSAILSLGEMLPGLLFHVQIVEE